MRKFTLSIFCLSIFITILGILIIFSTSANFAFEQYNTSFYFVKKQCIWLIIGLFVQLFIMKAGYKKLYDYAPYLFLSGLILLVLVLIPSFSVEIGGARRWLRLGPIGIQPSEFIKIILIVFMARYLSDITINFKKFFKGFLKPLLILILVIGLVLAEKDLGTSVIIGTVICLMFIAAGVRLRYVFMVFLSAIPLVVLAILKYPFRIKRIMSFLNPWDDPQNTSYQIIQSMVAISSGGWFGKGIGKGIQKYYYLPEAHTDFIFSIYAEETGFIGCLFLIGLFLLLISFGIRVTLKAFDQFGYLLAFGLTSLIGIQVIVNIGVVTSMLPTKGTPLPFISFGGSSLVMNMAAIGILISIERYSRERRN